MSFVYNTNKKPEIKKHYFSGLNPQANKLVFITDDNGEKPKLSFSVSGGIIVLQDWHQADHPIFLPFGFLERQMNRKWWYAPEDTVVTISYNE